jgi:V8-like Glu-specific endopeptidase
MRPAATAVQEDIDNLLGPSADLASPSDVVVRVVGPQMTCTGALVAEDIVLTAHHCVVKRGHHGEYTTDIATPSEVDIELGGDYLPWGHVGARAILAPSCGEAGGRGDIAAIVLERKLVGMATMGIQQSAPRRGEEVYTVGFGRCALSPEGIRRRVRQGGPIGSVAPGTFAVQSSVCPGDSGGPVLDRATHEVVGIVSLSAMDYDETTPGLSVFARLDDTPKMLAYARLIADGADPGDLPPLSCGGE